jgi:hypothetical protein
MNHKPDVVPGALHTLSHLMAKQPHQANVIAISTPVLQIET